MSARQKVVDQMTVWKSAFDAAVDGEMTTRQRIALKARLFDFADEWIDACEADGVDIDQATLDDIATEAERI